MVTFPGDDRPERTRREQLAGEVHPDDLLTRRRAVAIRDEGDPGSIYDSNEIAATARVRLDM